MDYGRLGNTGLTVSHLPGMHELGIRPFDTASAYSFGASEEITGRALRELSRPEDVVIATKVFNPMRPGPNGRGLSRKAILHEIDASLKRLATDELVFPYRFFESATFRTRMLSQWRAARNNCRSIRSIVQRRVPARCW
jgi:diketogulonate reductase-like aldo/keto reductase